MTDKKGASNYGGIKRQQYLSLTDIAYNVLLEGIINQDFQPGAVVSIDNLARQLKMSNTPVREALMRAHGERLVSQKTNHGFVVANILTPAELHQLFDVRYILEMHALAAAEITPEAVQTMTTLYEQMLEAGNGTTYDSFREYMVLDRLFHRAMIELANNKFLLAAWDDLHVHLHLSRLYTGIGLFDRSDSSKEHAQIVRALQTGSKDEATALWSQHIKRVENSMQEFLEN